MFRFVKNVIIITIVYASTKAQESNPLNEKHLRIITMELYELSQFCGKETINGFLFRFKFQFPLSIVVIRNSTGHVLGFSGVLPLHLEALSKMFNFSYSYILTPVITMEDILSTRGGISYLNSGDADFILSTSVATPSRFKYVDYPASWYNGPFGLIVPFPKETLNLKAAFKPFSYVVWITLVIATLAIMLYLRIPGIKWLQKWQLISNPTKNKENKRRIINFVLGNLVSQGQSFYSNQLAYRIAGGAWCVGCFFLIQIYCSTLTSHLTSSNQVAIVNSLEELAKNPDVDLTVDIGLGMDVLLPSMKTGIFKNLADKLNKDTKLRCNVTADCLEIVRNGHAAYSAPVNNLKFIVERDLKSSGICNYYIMKDSFLSSHVFNALPKNSPYTNTITTGILRFHQFGLYNKWVSQYLPEPRRCKELPRTKAIPRLSTVHLSSAFLILIFGNFVSIITFIFEKIIYRFHFLTKN